MSQTVTQTIAILGRQPALGRAELESLYGADRLQPVGSQAVLLNLDPSAVVFRRLGGSVKLAKLIASVNSTEWPQLVKYLIDSLPRLVNDLPEGKIRLGLSVYGLPTKQATIGRSGLELKKRVKQLGRSVRVVPNTAAELNAAQVIHNQLTGPTGLELLLIRHGKKTLLAQTVAVQDINAYAARDQARPKRDARVGMLPPKLAQIIANLAGTHASAQPADHHSATGQPTKLSVLLDPFCGTGVVLQEALLMGYDVYGTDLEPRMIDYSRANLDWLIERQQVAGRPQLEAGDATSHQWQKPFNLVAAETYLGRPFANAPDAQTLGQVIRDVDTIHRKFLRNLASQTEPGFRACLAVPAWHTAGGSGSGSVKHLPALDSLEELGYTRMSFVHARDEELVYHRPGQIVGRELVVITRK